MPDFAGALHEWMQIPRNQRRALVFGVSLTPLGFGVFVIFLAVVR
jgi:hypothetical protein